MLARALRPRPAAHLRRAAATRAQAAPRRAPALIGAASCAALGVCGAAAYADGAPLDRIQSFLFGSPAVVPVVAAEKSIADLKKDQDHPARTRARQQNRPLEALRGPLEALRGPLEACKAHSALDGGIVTVLIEEEVLAELPEMALDDVLRNGRSDGGDGVLLCTYQGIVYDVTAFASAHPGGRELLLTACGSDLGFYFANYTVHGASSKAAEWLAPLAVAKLSRADAVRAAALSTASCHVEKRMARLGAARRKLLCLALCLPAAIALRSLVRAVKRWVSTTVATWLAEQLPFAVPGVSPGAEMVEAVDSTGKKRKVAVVGGGVAGCGAAWMLAQSGYDVILYEARSYTSGNARTFDWDGFAATVEGNVAERPGVVKSCVSVTAWPPLLYKNYTALLAHFHVETVPMPLSWFLNSKVPGFEGTLWAATHGQQAGPNLRDVFARDFSKYAAVEKFAGQCTSLFTLAWAPWKRGDTMSMYTNHTGLGMLNPLNVVPLYTLCRAVGVTEAWWDIVFTPHYTASFLVDELRPFPAVFAPIIEAQIPLLPTAQNSWQGASSRSAHDCNITTCVTWKDAGTGIRAVFKKMCQDVDVRTDTRVCNVTVLPNGAKRVLDEHGGVAEVERVVFACPCNAIGNMYPQRSAVTEVVLNAPVYADDHHPATGHMHAVMHSDDTVIDERYRADFLKRGSNYVEITRLADGTINIENQYNFGVQTPGPGVYDLPLEEKPVMLISHALGEGKSIDESKIRGGGNHARAHPLYSGWNVAAQLSLRLAQGTDGVYYCSNWATPGNCHDMSLLSGFLCAAAIGAAYPFPREVEAKKDFYRLNELMGVF